MKKDTVSLGARLWTRRSRALLLTLALTIGLVCVGLLVFGLPRVLANPAPTIDGNGSDWNSPWEMITDSVNEIGGIPGYPHNDPNYARSGYDQSALWAYFENGVWYFRIDVDGRPGDSDSQYGSGPGDLGVGTTNADGGPLVGGSTQDLPGVSGSEEYNLYFRTRGTGGISLALKATNYLTAGEAFSPTADPGSNTGTAVAFGNSYNPGIIEWAIPKERIYLPSECQDYLRVSTYMGSSMDGLSEDGLDVGVLRLFYVNLAMTSTSPISLTRNGNLTYTLSYVISNSTSLLNPIPATNAYITSTVPANTQYVSHSGGASQSGPANGIVTWTLASPITPTGSSASETGNLTLVVRVITLTQIVNRAALRMDEGLCCTANATRRPTAVRLDAFSAAWEGEQVAVAWTTGMQLNTLGFNVWRSTSADGDYVQVNAALIPVAGGSAGGEYAFSDANVIPGETYYYKLEELETTGAHNWYGPAATGAGGPVGPTAVDISGMRATTVWRPAVGALAVVLGLVATLALRKRRRV